MAAAALSPQNLRYPQWQGEYQAVLLELDNQKLLERIAAAETAILVRVQAFAKWPMARRERQAIDDSLRCLRILKNNVWGVRHVHHRDYGTPRPPETRVGWSEGNEPSIPEPERAHSDGQSSLPIAGAATHRHQGWVGVHDEACCLKRLMSSQAQFVAAWIVIFIIAALAYWVYLQTAPMDWTW
jgi:hypothetical protein